MFKIGTGEGNTLAGKVYFHTKTDLTGALQWVYLNNKIYARMVDESLGLLNVISPDNFSVQGTVSLHCDEKDLLNNATSARFNKGYPLITDGTYLYIIVMRVVSRERELKEKYIEDVERLRAMEKEAKPDASQEKKPEDSTNPIPQKKSDMLFSSMERLC